MQLRKNMSLSEEQYQRVLTLVEEYHIYVSPMRIRKIFKKIVKGLENGSNQDHAMQHE